MAIGSLHATTIVNNGKFGYSVVQKHDSPVQSKLLHTAIPVVNAKSFDTQNIGSFNNWNNGKGLNNNGYNNGYGNAGGLYDNVYGSGYGGQYADYYVSLKLIWFLNSI